ncbi:MAG: aldo/keto reductase [Phenylobacterium sp.]|jgi:aryl-alcohol dehydrogenase-like predicted oxidoreductase|uniref:aldo/keto reductase n=1 Tax=Phenylobacterium sp. TaxID=1871053 RepID=UPI00391C8AE5
MRYRPFGASGKAVSAVSLVLREAPNMTTPSAWRALAFTAMENGVNAFEIAAGADVAALGVGEALRAVERRLIFLGWRLRGDPKGTLSAQAIGLSIRDGLRKTGAGYFDVLMMDETAYETLAPGALDYLMELRGSGVCLQLGVAGDGAAADASISSGSFDVLATPFSLISDWQARRRIREASARNMTMIGYDSCPAALAHAPVSQPSARRGLFTRPDPMAGVGTYAFLQETPGWSAEELCLAYALTEPAFATMQVEAFRTEAVERVAAVCDRDLPAGVSAQIEMARFAAAETEERRRA